MRLPMQAMRQLVNGSHTHLPHAWVVICERTSTVAQTNTPSRMWDAMEKAQTEAVCLGLVLASHVCSTAVPEHLGCKAKLLQGASEGSCNLAWSRICAWYSFWPVPQPRVLLLPGGTAAVIAMKLAMYLVCRGSRDSSVRAFALDHINDVVVNSVGLAGAHSQNPL